MEVTIYTDGASRGNPGKSASGYMIFDDKHVKIHGETVFNGIKTNNFAEYNAVILALKKALEIFGKNCNVTLYSDSKLVVNQVLGNYKIRDKYLKIQYMEAIKLVGEFASCKLINVPRENKYISMVDKSLNILLDKLEIEKQEDIEIKRISQKKLM